MSSYYSIYHHLLSCFYFGHIGQHCYEALSFLLCIQDLCNKLHYLIIVSKFLLEHPAILFVSCYEA